MGGEVIITNRKKIRECWKKTNEDVQKDIDCLIEWMKLQKHLPEVMDFNTLEFFLTNCKYSIERTKQCLDLYYTARKGIPELFNKNPKLPEMQLAKQMTGYYPLPKLTKEQYRVTVFKLKDFDMSEFNYYKVIAYCLNILEIRIHEDLDMGVAVIIDGEHMKFGHLLRFTPIQMKKISYVMERIIKIRVKGLHFVNCSGMVDKVMSLAKMVFKKKIEDRIVFHSSYESLKKYIPKDILPEDYGGTEKSLEEIEAMWDDKLKEYQQRFDKLDSFEVKEDLRAKPLMNSDEFGFYGNFKKLSID